MKLIFMGTPKFALPTLELIFRHFDLRAIISRPDKPQGRQMRIINSPVKNFAINNQIKLIQPATLKDNDELKKIVSEINPDAVVVAAYGKMLPLWLLEFPKYGCLNLHASLLPKYRGAAPIQRAIMAGEKITGVSTMKLAPELDAGPIYLQAQVKIDADDNSASLSDKLAAAGARIVLETLQGIIKERIKYYPQDDNKKATYAPKINKDEMKIDWHSDFRKISYLIRALAPRPGAYTIIKGKKVKILAAEPRKISNHPPQSVISFKKELIVAARNGALVLRTVKPEGKREMSGADFARGSRLELDAMI